MFPRVIFKTVTGTLQLKQGRQAVSGPAGWMSGLGISCNITQTSEEKVGNNLNI